MAATSGTFSIAAPSLTVTSPAAGASFYAGTSLAITWSTNLPPEVPGHRRVEPRTAGSTFEVLATDAPNTGSFAWIAHRSGDGRQRSSRVTVDGPG